MNESFHTDIYKLYHLYNTNRINEIKYEEHQGYMKENLNPSYNRLIVKYNNLVLNKNILKDDIVDKINNGKYIDWVKYNRRYIEILNGMDDISFELKSASLRNHICEMKKVLGVL